MILLRANANCHNQAARRGLLLDQRSSNHSNNRAAIAELYETQFSRVARYISVRIGNQSEAEDLASEVFARALKKADSFRETGAPLEAWLFRIAHNIVVDHLRGRSRRPPATPLDQLFDLGSEINPSDRLERAEQTERLSRAVAQLTFNQQDVLALRIGAGMSAEEAAKVLGKKPGAVRELQSAALKKLRTILGSE